MKVSTFHRPSLSLSSHTCPFVIYRVRLQHIFNSWYSAAHVIWMELILVHIHMYSRSNRFYVYSRDNRARNQCFDSFHFLRRFNFISFSCCLLFMSYMLSSSVNPTFYLAYSVLLFSHCCYILTSFSLSLRRCSFNFGTYAPLLVLVIVCI